MHKTVVPAILISTILIAGVFAFIPIQKASAVHFQIIDAINAALGDITFDLSGIHSWITGGHDDLSNEIDDVHSWVTGGHLALGGDHNTIINEIDDVHSWVTGGHLDLSGDHTTIINEIDDVHSWVTGGHLDLSGDHSSLLSQHTTILTNQGNLAQQLIDLLAELTGHCELATCIT